MTTNDRTHPVAKSYDAGIALRKRFGVTNDDCPPACIREAEAEAEKHDDPDAFMEGFFDSLNRA